MKKYTMLCASLCVAMTFTGCKSSESAYKKAYEKAKAQEAAMQQTEQPDETETNVVAPLVETPVNDTKVIDNLDNVQVKQETVSLVNGSGLKSYSVVVGSFSLIANAEGLQQTLKNAGYDAQIVRNTDRNMYRVVAATFSSKVDAAASRNEFRVKYPDAWLLFNGN